MLTLAMDASTYVASVALLRDARLVREVVVPMREPHRDALMPAVAAMLGSEGAGRLDRVICGSGPGSFTSLRIAASIAKGVAVGAGASLSAVSSLVVLVAGCVDVGPGRWLAVLDAMRGESYAQLVEISADGALASHEPWRMVRRETLGALARELHARTVGAGGEVEATPHVRGVARLLSRGVVFEPVDLASWEPDYGRLAEAQVKWEAAHGRPLGARAQ